jgi:hypothetical protein
VSPRPYLYFCTSKASKVTHKAQGIWDYDAKEDDDVSPHGWWDEQGVCVPAECFLSERL